MQPAKDVSIEELSAKILAAKESPEVATLSRKSSMILASDFARIEEYVRSRSFSAIYQHYLPLYRASKPLSSYDLALLAYAASRNRDQDNLCHNVAITSIQKNPLEHVAYAALAMLSMGRAQLHQAFRYAQLVRLTGRDLSVAPIHETVSFVEFGFRRESITLTDLRPLLFDETKFKRIEKLYPEAASNPVFMDGVAEIRARPADYEIICGDNPAIKNFVDWLKRDPNPEVIIEPISDDEINASCLLNGGSFAKLPQSIAIKIASHLPLAEQGRLRQTNAAMSARFGHWTIYRMKLLSFIDKPYSTPDTDVFYGPVGNLDWQMLLRTQLMVVIGIIILGESFEAQNHQIGYPVPQELDEATREGLRKLINRQGVHGDASWEHPENLLFLRLTQLVNIYKSPALILLILEGFPLAKLMVSILDFRSNVCASIALAAEAICWKLPNFATSLRALGFSNLILECSAAERIVTHGAACSLICANQTGFVPHPMGLEMQSYVERRTYADAESMSADQLISRTSFTPYAGLQPKSTLSGIYRLAFSFAAAELVNEHDIGILELIQEETCGLISGRGTDTFRGKFTVYDARMPKYIDKALKNVRANHEDLHQVIGIACDHVTLVLEYESGEAFILFGMRMSFSISGFFTKAVGWSKGGVRSPQFKLTEPEESDTIIGSFSLPYNHESSSAEPEERKIKFQELCKVVEEMTVPLKSFGPIFEQFQVYERVGLRNLPIEPEKGDYNMSAVRIRLWSRSVLRLQYCAVSPSDVQFFTENAQAMTPADLEYMKNSKFAPKWNIASESEAVYQARLHAWALSATHLNRMIQRFIYNYHQKAVTACLAFLEQGGAEAVGPIVSIWGAILRLPPNICVASDEFLLTILDIVYSTMKMNRDKIQDDPNILSMQGKKAKPKRSGGIYNTLFGTPLSTFITATSFLGVSLAIGIGAFVLGNRLSKPSQKKHIESSQS